MENETEKSTWQVLVVEDEPDNQEVIATTLQLHHVTVRTAKNGFEAIEALKAFTPNFVLCDLSMPGLNGWQTLTEIRNNPKTAQLPVIALTAHAMVGDRELALAKGFDGYIPKPIDVLTIFATLQAIMRDFAKKIPAGVEDKKPAGAPEAPVQPTTLTVPVPGQNDTTSNASSNTSLS